MDPSPQDMESSCEYIE